MTALLFSLSTSQPLKAEPVEIGATPQGILETGVPEYTRVGKDAMGLSTAPFDLLVLKDGRLLAVSGKELALGDGVRWQTVRASEAENTELNSVAVDDAGQLYAGIPGGIGKLSFLIDGKWALEEEVGLSDLLGSRTTALVYTSMVGEHWFWSSGSGPIVDWRPGQQPRVVGRADSPTSYFSTHGRIRMSDQSNGNLYELVDSEFKSTDGPQVPYSVEAKITGAADLDAKTTLISTLGLGIQVMEGSSRRPFTPSGLLATGQVVNALVAVGPGRFVAAIDGFGIVHFDASGRILQTLARSVDHTFGHIRKLVVQPNGTVWALTHDGLVGVRFDDSLSNFEPLLPDGLRYTQPYRLNGKLWMLSSGKSYSGAYDENGLLAGFEEDTAPGYVSGLLEVNGRILAGTTTGLYEREAVATWHPVNVQMRSPNFSDKPWKGERWLYAAENEFGWIALKNRRITVQTFPNLSLSHVYRAVTDGEGTLWAELGSGRVAMIVPGDEEPRCRIFDKTAGLPSNWVRLFVLKGEVKAISANGVLRFNPKTARFEAEEESTWGLKNLRATGRPALDPQDRLWAGRPSGVEILDRNGKVLPASSSLQLAPPAPEVMTIQEDGVIWLHKPGRLARFDPSVAAKPRRAPGVLITAIETPATNRTRFVTPGSLVQLAPEENSILAHFSVPEANLNNSLRFQISMTPGQAGWVDAGLQGAALFQQLKTGTYTLKVRAIQANEPGPETSLNFQILPHWYQTPAAFAGMAVVGLSTIAFSIVVPAMIQRRRKRELERLVQERTHKLAERETQIRELNHQLEERVQQRTEELRLRVDEVEKLNRTLDKSAAELSDTNIRLTATNKELESFSYSVSHDLRAPLRSIDGFSKALDEDYGNVLGQEGTEYLKRIRNAAQRMGILIDDLLKLARISRFEMKRENVDLSEMATNLFNHLRSHDPERVIDFHYHVNLHANGDPRLIQIALENLLENAWKYTRKREVARIEFGQVTDTRHPGYGMYFVKDNGAGFDMRYADKLFTAFNRLHNPADFEGTGIGLATVNRIIARHGGTIFAQAELGKGATFYFTLSSQRPTPPPKTPVV